MKEKAAVISVWALAIAANAAFIWILVELVKYIAKDDPFNWWSVGAFAMSCVAFGVVLFAILKELNND